MVRLLIVDDDRNLRTLYEQELTDEGYEVTATGSGKDALRLARELRPDLIVLDIAMPGMDGIEVLEKILSIDRAIPVVLNSAYSNYKDNFMTWSANAYVVKSGDLTELLQTIRRLLAARVETQGAGGQDQHSPAQGSEARHLYVESGA